ncbi:MAG: hypothetical protein A2Y70_02015 [Candidatus Aminicenantes bacterium RBG_13_64_14]|nr:MAG: hypothetical protein A2Y70_02015 [Candidatus Aminicenantes bacterium RBG_13_64_14]
MISTNTIKPKLDDSPKMRRGLSTNAEGKKIDFTVGGKLMGRIPKPTGGAFNFDGNRYPNVVKRTPNRPKGAIFSDQLRDIAAAKGRAARIAELRRQAAAKAEATEKAAAARKGLAKKARRAKRSKKRA